MTFSQRRHVREQVELLEHHPDRAAQLRAASAFGVRLAAGRASVRPTSTSPSWNVSSPLMQRSSVLFPPPDGPTSAATSPWRTVER